MLAKILPRILLLSVVAAFSSLAVQADPILVVGSGSNINSFGAFHFDLYAGNGSLDVHLFTGDTSNPIGCCWAPGQQVYLGFNGGGLDSFGSMTANGITYPSPTVIGDFHIAETPVFAPISPILGEFHVSTPFTYTGLVIACSSPFNRCDGPYLAQYNLFGGGTLDAGLVGTLMDNGSAFYSVRTVTYTFQNPEPASIILLLSGLTYLSAFGLRRRFFKR